MSQGIKIFDFEEWESKKNQIEDFSIHGHGPTMLKALSSKFLDPKKLLISWSMPHDVKIFDVEVWESKNLTNRMPQDVKSSEFKVLGSKTFEFKVL